MDSDEDNYTEYIDILEVYKNSNLNDLLEEVNNLDGDNVQTIQMRNYQTELATPGISGENVLICSPTGSGKTLVAIKIVQEHLKVNKTGKVAFLVPNVSLVDQQYQAFIPHFDVSYNILNLSGSNKSSKAPLLWILNTASIFIMTSDILKNALEEINENKLESINQFSLILFDECHNVDKKHSFNRIMSYYFKEKRANRSLPKIVGLTASPGTNKAKSIDEALNQLYTLCGNLDAHIISTVRHFKEELDQYQSVPDEKIIKAPARKVDQFDTNLQKEMEKCELILQEMNKKEMFPQDNVTRKLILFPSDRFLPKYMNIIKKLETDLCNVTCEMDYGKTSVITIAKYLRVLYDALVINHLFRSIDAIKQIRESNIFSNSSSSFVCPVEKCLRSNIQELLDNSGQYGHQENPAISILKENIKSQINLNADSRIIVFVRERIYTQILLDIFEQEIPSIKCDRILGGEECTKNETQEVIGRFNRGDINILLSTTIAEQGLDIPKCNMVIKYGHVTDEKGRIQSRGRARTIDSKYLVIVPDKLRWQECKEDINKYRESMMYKAINMFQKMSSEEIKAKIEEYQNERQLSESDSSVSQLSISDQGNNSTIWKMHCMKCGQFICTSKDIKLGDVHHFIINEKCFSTMKLSDDKTENNCKIICTNCNNHLCVRQIYKKVKLPNVKIEGFRLICEEDNKWETFTSWKKVPFQMEKVSMKELVGIRKDHCLSK